MIKISREVKIGLSVLVIGFLFFWGLNFLKGKDVFNPGYTLYGLYNRIDGLTKASPIYYKGFEIGTVRDIELLPGSVDELVVTMAISKKIEFPKNSVAQIYSLDLMGSKAISFIYGNSKEMLEPDDTMKTSIMGGLADQVSQEVLPLKDKAENLIIKFDSLLTGLNQVIDVENRASFKSILNNFQKTMQNFGEISGEVNQSFKSGGSINSSLTNLDSFSYSLKGSGADLAESASNIKNLTNKIADSKVDSSLVQLHEALHSLTRVLSSLEKGEGTMGQLIKDETLYENLNAATVSLDRLLNDVRHQPKRYVNFSVMNFGGGKQDVESENIVVYKVMIEKTKEPLDLRDREVVEGYKVKEDRFGKYYIYTVGEEKDYNEIEYIWKRLLEQYPDAKIIALKDGVEVSVKSTR